MRFVTFVIGLVLGIAGTVAYAVFINTQDTRAAAPAGPVATDAPISVTLGVDFLSSLVRHAVAESPDAKSAVDPNAVRVRLEPGAIIVDATLVVLGQSTQGVARLRPVVQNGQLRIEVAETTLGALPLPALDRALEQQLTARLHSLLDGTPVTVTGAVVDARGLTLTCRVEVEQLVTGQTAVR